VVLHTGPASIGSSEELGFRAHEKVAKSAALATRLYRLRVKATFID